MFDWWSGARYDRQGDVMIVRRARVLAAFWILGLVLGVLVLVTGISDPQDSGSGRVLGLLWIFVAAVELLWWRVPPVVADSSGIHLRSLLSRGLVPWDDAVGFEMKPEYGYWDLWPRLRVRLGDGRSRMVAGGSLTWLVPPQVAELRHLGRQLAHHCEAVGHGPRTWPERTRFERGPSGAGWT
jgi:hypothetical protein